MKLLPKDEKFFDLFVEQAEILKRSAEALHRAASVQSGDAGEVAGLEKEGDRKLHDILDRLNRTFITPIDPEDVSQIAIRVEDLIDQTESLAFRLSACDLNPVPLPLIEITERFAASAGLITGLFRRFQQKQMEEKDAVRADCEKIRGTIGEIVGVVRENLRDLYRREKDPLALIKKKDLFDSTETAARRFHLFTDLIQNVVAKNT